MAKNGSSDDEWKVKTQHFLDEIQTWKEQLSATDLVDPSSLLAQAEQMLSSGVIRVSAQIGLQTAVDHLIELSYGMQREDYYPRPFAPYTLLRSVMLGASQTIWVLCDSQEKGQERALMVAIDDYSNMLVHYRALRDNPKLVSGLGLEISGDISEIVIDLENNKSELEKQLRDQVGTGKLPKFESTGMIRTVANYIQHETTLGVDGRELNNLINHEWRVYSGSAHARNWSALYRHGINEGKNPDPAFSSSLQEFRMSWLTSRLLVKTAFMLWDKKRAPRPYVPELK